MSSKLLRECCECHKVNELPESESDEGWRTVSSEEYGRLTQEYDHVSHGFCLPCFERSMADQGIKVEDSQTKEY